MLLACFHTQEDPMVTYCTVVGFPLKGSCIVQYMVVVVIYHATIGTVAKWHIANRLSTVQNMPRNTESVTHNIINCTVDCTCVEILYRK